MCIWIENTFYIHFILHTRIRTKICENWISQNSTKIRRIMKYLKHYFVFQFFSMIHSNCMHLSHVDRSIHIIDDSKFVFNSFANCQRRWKISTNLKFKTVMSFALLFWFDVHSCEKCCYWKQLWFVSNSNSYFLIFVFSNETIFYCKTAWSRKSLIAWCFMKY